jgi:hypothetical protein
VSHEVVAKDIEPAPPRPSQLHLGIAVGPAIQTAPPSSTGATKAALSAGGLLRIALTYAQFGGSLGVVLAKSSQLPFGSITIDQFRVPLDASARIRLRTGQLEGTFDLGVLLALLREEYTPAHRAQYGVEAGMRAGLTLSWGERIVPWVGSSLEVLPAPIDLRFAPTGTVGHTPSVWLGVALGMEVRWP